MKKTSLLVRGSALTLAFFSAMPAMAQSEDPLADDTADAADKSTIIVTGSRILRPNLDSTVPITSVSADELTETGSISVGDQLNELPQLRATFSQANSTRFIGTAGQNSLDLRGLGTDRTLVLVNNRRHVSSAPGSFRWDTNNIPSDLIQRVDVVTGGNSAIYGSDAVAGVVNFILRRDYDGLQLRGQAGISDEGDAGTYFVSGLFGRNFAEGRGNITIAAEYARQNALYVLDRQQGRDRRQFQLTQNLAAQLNPANGPIRTGPEPSAGDGIPDTTFIGGLLRRQTSVGGMFVTACPTTAATGESAAAFAARRAATCTGIPNPASTNPLSQFGAGYAFQPDGTLLRNVCQQDFVGFGSGNCIGGFGSSLRESGQFQPELNRININVLGRFEVSPAFQPFFEGHYTRIKAVQEGAPTFGPNNYSINNPFLSTQARATLVTLLAPGVTTFTNDRQNLDFGARGEDHKRETYRVVAGVEGDFNDDWRYEVAANFGRFESYYETEGNYITSRFNNAINAVDAPVGYGGATYAAANGRRAICAINVDVIAAGLPNAGQLNTANDDQACVPVNLFGQGNVSPEALAYLGYTSSRKQWAEQFVLSAYMSGDTSEWFELPGGPIGFAIGGEYRRESQFSSFDEITNSGQTFLNSNTPFDPPAYKIKEAFAEIRIPLLKDMPFFNELTIEAAGRVSDYNLGNTGTVYAYNAGVIWSPFSDLRLRASYQRSVRAPTLGDLYTGTAQTFNNVFADPCAQQNINNGPIVNGESVRIKNCRDAGVPTTQTFEVGGVTTTEPFTNRPASGVSAANRGNIDLAEERGTSFTLGGVYQPSWAPGLSVSVDYWNIEVKNVIFTLTPQTVLSQCYDSPSGIDNPFCDAVTRLANGTLAGQRNVNHGGTTVTLDNPGFSSFGQPFNYARQKTSGIDLDVNYNRELNEDVTLSIRGVASYLISRDNYTDITRPEFINRQKSELGDPEWRFQVSSNLDFGKFNFNYRVQFIGRQILNGLQYETFFPLQDRAASDPDAAPFAYYPNQWYHNFRLEFEPNEGYQFYVGIDNAFDNPPPYDLLGTEAGSLYDPTGRFLYAGARFKF